MISRRNFPSRRSLNDDWIKIIEKSWSVNSIFLKIFLNLDVFSFFFFFTVKSQYKFQKLSSVEQYSKKIWWNNFQLQYRYFKKKKKKYAKSDKTTFYRHFEKSTKSDKTISSITFFIDNSNLAPQLPTKIDSKRMENRGFFENLTFANPVGKRKRGKRLFHTIRRKGNNGR